MQRCHNGRFAGCALLRQNRQNLVQRFIESDCDKSVGQIGRICPSERAKVWCEETSEGQPLAYPLARGGRQRVDPWLGVARGPGASNQQSAISEPVYKPAYQHIAHFTVWFIQPKHNQYEKLLGFFVDSPGVEELHEDVCDLLAALGRLHHVTEACLGLLGGKVGEVSEVSGAVLDRPLLLPSAGLCHVLDVLVGQVDRRGQN